MKFPLYEVLRHIKQGDIQSFSEDLRKYHLDINYNFHDEVLEDFDYFCEVPPLEELLEDATEQARNFNLVSGMDYEEDYTFIGAAILYNQYHFCKYLLNNFNIPNGVFNRYLKFAIKSKNKKLFDLIYKHYYSDNFYPKDQIIRDCMSFDNIKLLKNVSTKDYLRKMKNIWLCVGNGGSIDIAEYLISIGNYPTNEEITDMLSNSTYDDDSIDFDWLLDNLCKNEQHYTSALFTRFDSRKANFESLDFLKFCINKGVDINLQIPYYEPFFVILAESQVPFEEKKECFDYIFDKIDLSIKDSRDRNFFEYVYIHYQDNCVSKMKGEEDKPYLTDINYYLYLKITHDEKLLPIMKESISHKIAHDKEWYWERNLDDESYKDEDIIEE